MFLTRKAEFSASHVCRVPSFSDAENRSAFGDGANPNGHGHNYIVEVTIEGNPDPLTGMVIDLKLLKDILDEEVIEPMDHRFLNYEVAPFDEVIPTAENVAAEIWRRLATRLNGPEVSLSKVRLYETSDLYVDVTANEPGSQAALGQHRQAIAKPQLGAFTQERKGRGCAPRKEIGTR